MVGGLGFPGRNERMIYGWDLGGALALHDQFGTRPELERESRNGRGVRGAGRSGLGKKKQKALPLVAAKRDPENVCRWCGSP